MFLILILSIFVNDYLANIFKIKLILSFVR